MLKNLYNVYLKNFITTENGFIFFKFGILFLPTLPFISGILLLISSIFGTINRTESFLKDQYNYPFVAIGILMIISCLRTEFVSSENVNSSLNWISLINWLPFFWFFWSFKSYLKSEKLRTICANYFIFGSIPLLISGLIQYFFKWYGPFEFFNGLIIWYLRPICAASGENICVTGLTGFFNNPNITGSYLAILVPFSLYFLTRSIKKKSISRIFYLIILLSILISIFLTTSRNAWLGAIISFLIFFNKSWIFLALFFLLSVSLPLLINNINFIPENIKILLDDFIPYNLRSKFLNFGFNNINNYPRFSFFDTAIKMIISKPLFGWGATMYTIVYEMKNSSYSGHPHNLILELAINYGIFAALIFAIYVIWLIKKSIQLIKEKRKNSKPLIDKAFYASLIVILITHLFDIPYYDVRISICFWILIASMRGIIFEIETEKPKEVL